MKRLTGAEFTKLLGTKVQEAGSQKVFAQTLGVSEQYVSDLLRNRRSPGPKLLNSLGFREIRLYEREEEKDEE